MKKQYESITKYLPKFAEGDFGYEPEQPTMGDVFRFREWVNDFLADYHKLMQNYKKADLTHYPSLMPDPGSRPVETYTEVEAMATIIGAIRAERFCDGALSGAMQDGLIEGCLRVLEKADNGGSEAPEKRCFSLFRKG